MTRVIVDTRSCRGCWVAAHVAGLFDLDVVALITRESPNNKLLNRMTQALGKASKISQISNFEIPCHTIDAVGVVAELACPGDVIMTDSAPIAYEFLQKSGEATDSYGKRYEWQSIAAQVRHLYACKELMQLGINPYKTRRYRDADCWKLYSTLKELIGAASGLTPKSIPLEIHRAMPAAEIIKPVSASEFERGPEAKVFIDGDSCPRLPAIIEICGNAHVPIVFVSNSDVKDLIGSACKKDPDLLSKTPDLPDVAIEKVPLEKNETDLFIERHIASGDIVLTDDTGLMAVCMNKGALAIDYHGRALGRPQGIGMVSKNDVKLMKVALSTGSKKKSREGSFRRSLLQAVQ